ncbi:Aldo/keto reductase [Ophiobolus disseminans]|uniref:Aldo/keto reductase n=1 Tax=Ophiobolus disseminans TaxID=1469910 RepID=A0A6A6ZJ00_9PLEO|nr:Aldo/keto reductase [Ophiobolus disseminans]
MAAILALTDRVSLCNGTSMPSVHLGTYLTNDNETFIAVLEALNIGYRGFDSAQMYDNEAQVGAAINHWLHQDLEDGNDPAVRSRSDIHFTTKLASNSSYDETKESILRSLESCGLGYIDLFLLHSPYGGPEARRECWRAIEDAISEGLIRSGGVSNFGKRHLEELLASDLRVKPSVNQIEVHPFNTRTELVGYCQAQGLQVQAYCPLVHGLRMAHATVVSMAEKHSCTAAQVLIQWSVLHGFVPLPKTTQKQRMVENADLSKFKLSVEDLAILDSLDEGLVTDWDPTDAL